MTSNMEPMNQFSNDHNYSHAFQPNYPTYNLPISPEGHVVDFVLFNEEAAQSSIPLLTKVYPPERAAHSDPSFYRRILDDALDSIRAMQPYASLQAKGIDFYFECNLISYMVEPMISVPTEHPTPYYYYFQLPLTDDIIPNLPYPLILPSSTGPHTRIKITLRFVLNVPTNPTQRTTGEVQKNPSDIFDQFTSLTKLVNTIVRDHLHRETPPTLPRPTLDLTIPKPSPSTSGFHWKRRSPRKRLAKAN
jgi:hypothetical protein